MEFLGKFKHSAYYYTQAKETTDEQVFLQVIERSIKEV
jgi:hypothetical protein